MRKTIITTAKIFGGALAFAAAGCSGSSFSGGAPLPSAPIARVQPSNATANQVSGVPVLNKSAPASILTTVPISGQSITPQPAIQDTLLPATPPPLVGPQSDLTLTINDRDSKLDVFQVKNVVSQQWIPLTWQFGSQTIPGACTPNGSTQLSLQMHSGGGLFDSPMSYQIGSCNAPLSPVSPNAVKIGIDPSCGGNPKATFTLSCSGSSNLQVGP